MTKKKDDIDLGGRPPVFKNVKAFNEKVDEYFVWIQGEYHMEERTGKDPDTGKEEVYDEKIWDRHPEPPTITGLCLFMGFESRQSFFDYKEREGFSYAVKRARMRIESEYEKNLLGRAPAGSIFALKNLGWSDKQEVDHTTGGKPIENRQEIVFRDYSKK